MATKPAKKGGRPNTKDMTKADKFIILANARVSKVLAQMRNLKRLANRRNYDFNQFQVNRINEVVREATADVTKAFDDALKGGATVTEKALFDITAKE